MGMTDTSPAGSTSGSAGRVAAAVVLLGDVVGLVDRFDDLRGRVSRLTGHGVHVAVAPGVAEPSGPWTGSPSSGPRRLVLAPGEPGPEALRRLLADFGHAGIGSGLVLVVRAAGRSPALDSVDLGRAVVVPVDGESALYRLLDLQLRSHERYRVPGIDEDPAWTVVFDEGCGSGGAPSRRS